MISLNTDKVFKKKIQHPFMIKAMDSLGIYGTYINIIKVI